MSQVLDRPPPAAVIPSDDVDLAALAARHGLTATGVRPSLPEYVRQLWARRSFIAAFATAKLTAQYSQVKLGQMWQVMNPLLNAAVYYLVFGVLLDTKRGVPDYVPFLVTGVFVWTFTQSSILAGTRAISGNLGLVRALHFPRAALPISCCLQQLQQLLFSMAVLVVILLFCGVPVSVSWVLTVPALLLQFTFNAGISMITARAGAETPDIAQLMPFVLRTWMYVSGVMWSVGHVVSHDDLPYWAVTLLQANPAAVYIDLVRFALIDSFHSSQLPPHVWLIATGWAALAGVGGFICFWSGEETYGRG